MVSQTKVKCLVYCEMCECTYIRFHSVEEPSKNHGIWFRVMFGSLRGLGFGSMLGKKSGFLFGSYLLVCWFFLISSEN